MNVQRLPAQFVAALVGVGLLVLLAFGMAETQRQDLTVELNRQTIENKALSLRAERAETELSRVESAQSETLSTREADRATKRKTVTTEKFDPESGKLTERQVKDVQTSRDKEKTRTATKQTQTATTKSTTKTEATTRTETAATTTTETSKAPAAAPRMGINVGGLATAAGPGVAASATLISLGAVHLDAVAGVVVATGRPSPRGGISVSGELTPRLSVGVAALVAPQGDPLGVYHPILPVVGLAPALIVQYRF